MPTTLERILGHVTDAKVRSMVQRNLDDETGVTATAHLELFERFAAELGEQRGAAPSPAMTTLVTTYRVLSGAGPSSGLAALLAYEAQAAEIAESKARGLTRLYELPAGAVEFWDVHASADVEHADWGMEALAALDDSPSEVATSARAAADAWWSFLDEREVEYSAAR